MEKILSGEIVNVIFSNEEGFKICSLFIEDDIVVIKGILPKVEVGQNIECVVKEVNHPKFGLQYEVKSFKEIFPTKIQDIERYLLSGAINGIGAKLAQKIVENFKEDSLIIIENHPEELSKIRGISSKKANEISHEFQAKRMLFRIMEELNKYKLSIEVVNKLYEKYKENTIEIIRKDPYLILENTNRISFFEVDKIALNDGININYDKRIRAAIKYAIKLSMNNGNTYVLKENLIEYIKALTLSDLESIEIAIKNMEVAKELIIRDDKISEYRIGYFEIENAKNINLRIEYNKEEKKTKKKQESEEKEILQAIKEVEKERNILLTSDQTLAILNSIKNNITIITGGPGTGKTTITSFIIEVIKKIKDIKKGIILTAPTGKAAKRITDLTGHLATTIHRLMELNPDDKDILEVKKIYSDILIVDEASMLDTVMLYYLLHGLNIDSKIVFIGDSDQLESVGPGNVLKDMIESEIIQVVKLKEIFRQAQDSNIIINAHRINEGKYISINVCNKLNDLIIHNVNSSEEMLSEFLKLLDTQIQEDGIIEFYDSTQILSPTKKGICGILELNRIIQERYNILRNAKKGTKRLEQKEIGKIIFKENDRIIQIKNNYNRIWKYEKASEKVNNGIFNGEMGIILKVNKDEKCVEIIFDDRKNFNISILRA